MRMSKLAGRAVVVACALVLSVVVLAVAQAPAYSHDHRPPNAPFLYKGQQELQRARWQEYCWFLIPSPDGFGTLDCTLFATTFPVADPLGAGSTLHLRILKVQRPVSFGMRAWRSVDANGTPTRRSQLLPSTLRPVRQDGGVGRIFRGERAGPPLLSAGLRELEGRVRDRPAAVRRLDLARQDQVEGGEKA